MSTSTNTVSANSLYASSILLFNNDDSDDDDIQTNEHTIDCPSLVILAAEGIAASPTIKKRVSALEKALQDTHLNGTFANHLPALSSSNDPNHVQNSLEPNNTNGHFEYSGETKRKLEWLDSVKIDCCLWIENVSVEQFADAKALREWIKLNLNDKTISNSNSAESLTGTPALTSTTTGDSGESLHLDQYNYGKVLTRALKFVAIINRYTQSKSNVDPQMARPAVIVLHSRRHVQDVVKYLSPFLKICSAKDAGIEAGELKTLIRYYH